MIKAVIFDCFGVLTTESFDVFRDKYLGSDDSKRQVATKAMNDVNTGLIGYGDFLTQLSGASGLSTAEIQAILSKNSPNEPLLDYIRTELKPKYKIGILSNAGGDWISEMFPAEDITLFDSIVLSFRAGVIKPQPEAYQLAARELGVEPSEAVFIDDRQKYCDGAKAAGMQAVAYDNFSQFKKDLETTFDRSE